MEQEQEQSRRGWWKPVLTWAAAHKIWAAVIVLVLVSVVAGPFMEEEPSETQAATAQPSDQPESESPESPEPTPKPKPQEVLADAVRDALGDSNRDDVERVQDVTYLRAYKSAVVTWAIDDNLTEGLLKEGVEVDIADILQAVQESGVKVKDLNLQGTFSMVDQLGNASEDTVVRATYKGSTISAINFDNFLTDNVFEIAEAATLHPEFQS